MDITGIEPDEFDDYQQAIYAGFGDPPLGEQAMAAERAVKEIDRIHAARDGGRFVGGTAAFSFELTVPGGARVPAAGVSDVAILPTHTGRGILRELMVRQLDEVAERGEAAALLNSSDSGIYGRFGYGPADDVVEFEIDNRHAGQIRPPDTGGELVLVDRTDAAAELADVYDRVARRRPGALGRSAAWWDYVLGEKATWRGGASPSVVVHRDGDGRTDGYALYRFTGEWGDGHAEKRVVHIRELEGATTEIEARLWDYCCSIKLTRTVRAWPRPGRRSHPLAAGRPPTPAHPAEQRPLVGETRRRRSVAVGSGLPGGRFPGARRARRPPAGQWWDVPRRRRPGRGRVPADRRRTGRVTLDRRPGQPEPRRRLGLGSGNAAGRLEEHTDGALRRASSFLRWDESPLCITTF